MIEVSGKTDKNTIKLTLYNYDIILRGFGLEVYRDLLQNIKSLTSSEYNTEFSKVGTDNGQLILLDKNNDTNKTRISKLTIIGTQATDLLEKIIEFYLV